MIEYRGELIEVFFNCYRYEWTHWPTLEMVQGYIDRKLANPPKKSGTI